VCRRGYLFEAVTALGHGTKTNDLPIVHNRYQDQSRVRRSGRTSCRTTGQRSFANVGPPGDAPVACLHSLRSLLECMPRLSANRRTCVRIRLPWTDWCGDNPTIAGPRENSAVALCVQLVRGLS